MYTITYLYCCLGLVLHVRLVHDCFNLSELNSSTVPAVLSDDLSWTPKATPTQYKPIQYKSSQYKSSEYKPSQYNSSQ